MHTQVVKNGVEIGRVFAGSEVARWPQMGSVTIVTYLEKEDLVYSKQMSVHVPGRSGHYHGGLYCSFSGAKI